MQREVAVVLNDVSPVLQRPDLGILAIDLRLVSADTGREKGFFRFLVTEWDERRKLGRCGRYQQR
jgi:hypothetical protein